MIEMLRKNCLWKYIIRFVFKFLEIILQKTYNATCKESDRLLFIILNINSRHGYVSNSVSRYE